MYNGGGACVTYNGGGACGLGSSVGGGAGAVEGVLCEVCSSGGVEGVLWRVQRSGCNV